MRLLEGLCAFMRTGLFRLFIPHCAGTSLVELDLVPLGFS